MTKQKLQTFLMGQHIKAHRELNRLSKMRYCGDADQRDETTHDLAFNRGMLKAISIIYNASRLKGGFAK